MLQVDNPATWKPEKILQSRSRWHGLSAGPSMKVACVNRHFETVIIVLQRPDRQTLAVGRPPHPRDQFLVFDFDYLARVVSQRAHHPDLAWGWAEGDLRPVWRDPKSTGALAHLSWRLGQH